MKEIIEIKAYFVLFSQSKMGSRRENGCHFRLPTNTGTRRSCIIARDLHVHILRPRTCAAAERHSPELN